jgi:hypothetical protein
MHRSRVGAVRSSVEYCAWCGQALLRKHAEDGHRVKYHVICLAQRRAILPEATPGTPSLVIRALGSSTACLACLVSATGLPELEIISALQRLKTDVDLAVGSCSRCGGEEARLLCGLVAV